MGYRWKKRRLVFELPSWRLPPEQLLIPNQLWNDCLFGLKKDTKMSTSLELSLSERLFDPINPQESIINYTHDVL